MRGNLLFKLADRWLGVALIWLLAPWKLVFHGHGRRVRPGARVLVIKFSAMGDTLLLLPVLEALRRSLGPRGTLEMVATPVNRSALAHLAGTPRGLNALHIIEPGRMMARPWELLALLGILRRRRFDLALDFDQWLRASALLAFASGADTRIGFRTPGQARHGLYDESLKNLEDVHEFEQFKNLAALAGLDRLKVEPFSGFLLKEGYLGAARAERARRPLVVMHPGTGGRRGRQREWPVERYAELGLRLRKKLGAKIALSGAGEYERGLCASIEKGMGPSDEDCVDSGLKNLVALLSRADLLVCGNTGVMHMAAGLGTPLAALHGPNPPGKWGPTSAIRETPPRPPAKLPPSPPPRGEGRGVVVCANLPCSPCLNLGFEFGCRARPCMEAISVDQVYRACLDTLSAARPAVGGERP